MELEEKGAYHSALAYRDLPRTLHLLYQGIKLSTATLKKNDERHSVFGIGTITRDERGK